MWIKNHCIYTQIIKISTFFKNKININEILISKRLFPDIINLNEHVIGYKHNHNIKPLYIKLHEYVCSGSTFKENITIPSEINDADFFEKYNKTWKKIEELMGINFERKPILY